jgi:hypothetical protein
MSNIEQLVQHYIQIRDEKARISTEQKLVTDRLARAMKKIEEKLLAEMQILGTESMRTSSGTCYRSIRTSATVDDRDTFMAFAVQHPEFLESRANKTAVEEYIDTTGEVPPGVRVSRMATIGVRRT